MLNNFIGSKNKLRTLWNKNQELKNKITDRILLREQIIENIILKLPNGTQVKVPQTLQTNFQIPNIFTDTVNGNRFHYFEWELTFSNITAKLLSYLQTNIIIQFGDNNYIYTHNLTNLIDDQTLQDLAINEEEEEEIIPSVIDSISTSEVITEITPTQFIYRKGINIITQIKKPTGKEDQCGNPETESFQLEDFKLKLDIKIQNPHIYY